MRVLVFGDSTTQGFWDSEGGWVTRLRKFYDLLQLEDLKNRDEPTVFNLGISGGTSTTILSRFDAETKARDNGGGLCIIITTGLNDSYQIGKKEYKSTPELYEANLSTLAIKAKNFSDKIMFVGLGAPDEAKTTPVFWKDIYYIPNRVKKFEDIMRKVAGVNDIVFVPIFEKFKEQSQKKDMLADGLHPNNNGHEFIFKLVQPELDKLLNT